MKTSLNNQKQRQRGGFTLVEIAIVLIVLGMLTLFGTNIFIGIVKDDKNIMQRAENKKIQQSILHFAQLNGRLPTNAEFDNLTSMRRDIYGNPYTYIPSIKQGGKNICANKDNVSFMMRYCKDAACTDNSTIDNVSFVLYSHGSNGTPDAVYSETPQVLSIYTNPLHDDIISHFTMLEMKAESQCSAQELKRPIWFLTEILPLVDKKNVAYSPKLPASIIRVAGSDNNTTYSWCVTNFRDIDNFPIGKSGDIAMYSGTQAIYLRGSCDDGDYLAGNDTLRLYLTGASSTSKDAMSASFDVFVKDSNNNVIEENFLFQLYYFW